MSFQSLKVDELKKVAASFAVEPVVADEAHGPTKKELLAALAENGVSWKDYQDLQTEVEDDDEPEEEVVVVEEAEAVAETEVDAPVAEEEVVEEEAEEVEVVAATTDEILVKYIRKNPTWEQGGHRFTKDHPFKSLPTGLAERLIKSGVVVQALPSEVKDYYN